MKDFKRASKLLIQKNGFMIALTVIFALIFSFFTNKSAIDSLLRSYSQGLVVIETIAKDPEEIDTMYIHDWEETSRSLMEKFPDKLPGDVFSEYDGYYERASEYYKNQDAKEKSDDIYYGIQVYKSLRFADKNLNPSSYENKGIDQGKIVLGKQLGGPIFAALLFSLILSFLFTSAEHLTPYYEFTRMVPWSQSEFYLYKIVLGLLLSILAYILILALAIITWKTSYFSNLLIYDDLGRELIFGLLRNLMFYIGFVALGTVAGNILGHLGMLIIGFGGPNLLTFDYRMVRDILGLGLSNTDPIFVFEDKIRPTIFFGLYSPAGAMDYSLGKNLIGLLLFTIIIFFLGLYWAKTSKAERSGMLVLKRGVSNFAFFMAVVTTIGLIGQITLATVDMGTLPSIIIHGALAYIIYRLYKILFSIRIGV